MSMFISGLLLFFILHVATATPSLRKKLAAGMGENAWKGIVALGSLGGIVLIVLGWAGGKWLTPWMSVFSLLAYIPLIWSIVRMYSRNVEARRRENARWIGFCNRVKDRDNRYFKCPRCRQMVRVPRGKGTINIRCPKCGTQFTRKT